VNIAPPLGASSTEIVPPKAVTVRATMSIPSPAPPPPIAAPLPKALEDSFPLALRHSGTVVSHLDGRRLGDFDQDRGSGRRVPHGVFDEIA